MFESFRDPTLNSILFLTDDPGNMNRYRERDFFKIIWNRTSPISISLDGLDIELNEDQITCLTPLQRPEFLSTAGEQYLLFFNREFYCIHENDHEVSCEGLLFWGSSELPVISLNDHERPKFETLFTVFRDELSTRDHIQGEMLRMLLKRLIIKGTRLAREQHFSDDMARDQADLIRRYNVLVEQHFRKHHQVHEYAKMLHKSPKTLSNVFAAAGHRTPLEVIHQRILLEGKRQLLKTDKMAKEIAFELGFEDQSHFSRFFKKETGIPPSTYRKQSGAIEERKN
ncbi:MAG: helix-turn-helix domain-containing protein [Balneolaceae bacterium]|nr:helix-turn-helix domain-containing protein [Balneolaceae bacterium]